ncbi:NAD(P) transhydrogenase subunit alpha [Reichenbachiella agarivorans]|uniref:proton-translocating NAD(P)(+) transhydrogenase n=1 Tax=Reichenbachiella agarivorans TaxID=2979464 RepID=A0ABY6CJK7_9BACT|nr:NAD(P) transhydrogenase subunit alpha [Reichenbachiella agarivorans]UXP30706.1 NAD(P) transhydrogenase subunit alpha [Reichenbachiella agarivorans]
MMIIGVLKCTEENLVAIVPKVVSKYTKGGFEILVERGAGEASHYTDDEYEEVGAKVAPRAEILAQSGILLTVTSIGLDELKLVKKGAMIVGKFNGRVESDLLTALKSADAHAFSLDLLPRSTIAQSMDVLSSLASLSGYKAVLLGADNFGGYFPMMTTSAGTIPPAKVLIIGAGVAGLQAIATAKRLGAVVEVFDVRSAVKEEVESLGAKFVEVEGAQESAAAGGYAIQQTEEYIEKQKTLIHQTAAKADVVITTANIPGRKAPLLIEERTVNAMKPGSVIIDMATASGGNVALSKDNATVEVNGVKIIGDTKLYNHMGSQSSFVYSNNIYNFLNFLLKEGIENIPYENEIVTNTLLKVEKEETVSA